MMNYKLRMKILHQKLATYNWRLTAALLCILCFVFCTNIIAQNVKFVAKVDKKELATSERLTITFELVNAQGDKFRAPDLSNFKLLSGPNQSSNFQFINGKTSSSISFSYIVMAFKEGEFEIGSASIESGGKKLSTDPIKIKVVKGANVNSNANNQNQGNASSNQAIKGDGNVFIKMFVDKSKVYQGEQIIVTYKLYTRASIVDYEIKHSPTFDGFWSKDVELGQVNLTPESYNGQNYYAATLKKNILFPQKHGRLKVDPLKMNITVRVKEKGNPYDVFDQFFGRYKDIKYELESNVYNIEVQPLPEQGKPESFSGAVGTYNFKVETSKNKLKANEALNIKVKINGTGNINLIDKPVISFPTDFELYDPKINDQTSSTAGLMRGKKEWDFLVIPRTAGHFNIDPVKFSYFDPIKKKYIELKSEPIILDVEKDLNAANNTVYQSNNPNQKEIATLGKDIRYIKTGQHLQAPSDPFFGSTLHLLGLSFPLLLTLGLLYFNKKQNEFKADTVQFKKSKANKIALKRLKSAKILLDKPSANVGGKDFYEEIFNALNGYAQDKFHIQLVDLSKDSIKQKLSQMNIDPETIKNFTDTIAYCEMARFSPVSEISKEEIYQKSMDIITKLEK